MTDTVKGLIAAAVACAAPLAPPLDAQRKDFIGAEACRPCHSSQFARQSATGHASALRRVMEHPLAARFTTTEPLLRAPNFHFSFVTADDGLHVFDLWDSPQQFQSFVNTRLSPATQRIGIKGQPKVDLSDAHAVFAPNV